MTSVTIATRREWGLHDPSHRFEEVMADGMTDPLPGKGKGHGVIGPCGRMNNLGQVSWRKYSENRKGSLGEVKPEEGYIDLR